MRRGGGGQGAAPWRGRIRSLGEDVVLVALSLNRRGTADESEEQWTEGVGGRGLTDLGVDFPFRGACIPRVSWALHSREGVFCTFPARVF